MHSNSTVFIQTSQANMCKNNEFDTIYHEHINFFNEKSIEMMIGNVGFKVLELNKLKVSAETCDYVFQVICQLNVVEY